MVKYTVVRDEMNEIEVHNCGVGKGLRISD